MPTRADELIHAVTDDGWRLALHRYRASGSVGRRHVVVCCHGLGANNLAFDVDERVSLARHLASRGYQVVSVDLRGHGLSERPRLRGPRRFDWSFDDYLVADLPVLIAAASALGESSRPVHWIGHSMGGLLLYAHLSRGGSSTIRSGVTLGSSLDYSGGHSGFHRLLPLRGLLRRLPAVPVGAVARLSGRFVGRVTTAYERFNIWPSNCDPVLWRRICEGGFHSVSPAVMAQLASAMEEGGLRSADSRTRYLDGLGQSTAPVLSLVGSRDAQCPPEAAAKTVDVMAAGRGMMQVFGKEQGHADHYGHFDLLMGQRAKHEVFPHIDRWLDAND
jgi:pimeloyl-ACP methyl ester carboxylesterase